MNKFLILDATVYSNAGIIYFVRKVTYDAVHETFFSFLHLILCYFFIALG